MKEIRKGGGKNKHQKKKKKEEEEVEEVANEKRAEPFRIKNVYRRNIDSSTPLSDEPTDLFNLLSVNFI